MKRFFYSLLALMAVTFGTLAFTACGGGDDDEGIIDNVNSTFTGGWRGDSSYGSNILILRFEDSGSIGVGIVTSNSSNEKWGHYSFSGSGSAGLIRITYNDGTSEQLSATNISSNSMNIVKDNVLYYMTRAEINDSGSSGSSGGSGSSTVSKTCTSCKGTGKCNGASGFHSCHGTGKCNSCDGKGYKGTSYYTYKCSTCNGTGVCTVCDGTGICIFCNGTGIKK